jgi:hypothetical protein
MVARPASCTKDRGARRGARTRAVIHAAMPCSPARAACSRAARRAAAHHIMKIQQQQTSCLEACCHAMHGPSSVAPAMCCQNCPRIYERDRIPLSTWIAEQQLARLQHARAARADHQRKHINAAFAAGNVLLPTLPVALTLIGIVAAVAEYASHER